MGVWGLKAAVRACLNHAASQDAPAGAACAPWWGCWPLRGLGPGVWILGLQGFSILSPGRTCSTNPGPPPPCRKAGSTAGRFRATGGVPRCLCGPGRRRRRPRPAALISWIHVFRPPTHHHTHTHHPASRTPHLQDIICAVGIGASFDFMGSKEPPPISRLFSTLLDDCTWCGSGAGQGGGCSRCCPPAPACSLPLAPSPPPPKPFHPRLLLCRGGRRGAAPARAASRAACCCGRSGPCPPPPCGV